MATNRSLVVLSEAILLDHRVRSQTTIEGWRKGEKKEPVNTHYVLKILDVKNKIKQGI